MKEIYKRHLETASLISNEADRLVYLTSVLRSLLQVAVVSSFEIINGLTPSDEIDLSEFIKRLCRPSDGLPLEIIDSIIPFLRTYIDKQFMYGWYEKSKSGVEPINKQLISWVAFRNSRQGHGVLDVSTSKEWSRKTELLVRSCLEVFKAIIPAVEGESVLKLFANLNNLCLKTPLIRKGEAIVITNVAARKGIWSLKGQILSRVDAEMFSVNLPEDNIFSLQNANSGDIYHLAEISPNGKDFSFFHNIPIRQTATFEGRKKELSDLADWIEDEDSRYCLVFGDGGYGKTTLVLEFLNQYIDDQIDLHEPLPTIISYHTAKMTKWTEDGITHFRGISTAMGDSVRELMRFFEPVLGKEWYTLSDKQLVDKAAGILATNKLNRDDILLIFDNTETLATSTQESQELGAFFKLVGKKIGRIIITSRRREFIEASPIIVEGLSEQECIRLMQTLADDCQAQPIKIAGEPRLRKVCQQLTNKPLLIEALVKYISSSGLGIDSSIDHVFRKSNEELLEFLYEDAWIRMNEEQQQVFLVLVLISSPLDQHSVSQACQVVGIPQTEFQSSLDETYFASVTDYGSTYTLEMVDMARRFFQQQFGKLCSDTKETLKAYANEVDSYVLERARIEKEYKSDRVAEAFRSEFAKAAKIHVDKNEISNAIEMFELAIEDDPLNAALHDRFSWLLFNKKQDYDYAERMAKKALELDPKNCDALVNIALIYYRVGNITLGDEYIDKAKNNGRTHSFCLLRKGIARYHLTKSIGDASKSISTLEDALDKLTSALRINDKTDRYYPKNKQAINKYITLTKIKLKHLRTKNTKGALKK